MTPETALLETPVSVLPVRNDFLGLGTRASVVRFTVCSLARGRPDEAFRHKVVVPPCDS